MYSNLRNIDIYTYTMKYSVMCKELEDNTCMFYNGLLIYIFGGLMLYRQYRNHLAMAVLQ